MKRLVLTLIALASLASAQQTHLKWKQAHGDFVVSNMDAVRTVQAFFFKAAPSANTDIKTPVGFHRIALIYPNHYVTYAGMTDVGYRLDGVLYTDGSVEGPNTWGIDKHYQLWRDVMKGGPAFPANCRYAECGDSVDFVSIWKHDYHRLHGHDPLIIYPTPAPAAGVPGTMNQNTWNALGYYHGQLQTLEHGPGAECDLAYLVFSPLNGEIDTTSCGGSAQCYAPFGLGGSHVSVIELAYSGCPLSSISAAAYLNWDGGSDPAAYATAATDYEIGLQDSQYSIDSCVMGLYISPPETSFCNGDPGGNNCGGDNCGGDN